jgi:16S rRNA (adenine1518-N6/adenine1519-N6)-dimethyltransferase
MNKKLGQHFLINKSAIGKIISALDLKPDETIIEIGPGGGALTFPILEQCQKLNCKLIAIEKDPELVKSLKLKVKSKNLGIVEGNALKILPAIINDSLSIIQSYKVVGNIPYYITGKLLRILSELKKKPGTTVLMIQKEVAERLSAEEGEINLLAATKSGIGSRSLNS